MAIALAGQSARPVRASQAPGPPQRRVPVGAGGISRLCGLPDCRRIASRHHAASLLVLVFATTLSAGRTRAQQPVLPPVPARDSARGTPTLPLGLDSTLAGATPDTARVDSTGAFARADTTCAARTNGSGCVASALRRDSTGMHRLLLVAKRKLLQQAEGVATREPRTSGEYFRAAFGPAALLRAGAAAGFEQIRGRPGWLPPREGYALRLGLYAGTNALAMGIRYETARWLGVWSVGFQPCSCSGTGPRLAHALSTPLRAQTDLVERFSPFIPLTELSSGMLFAAADGGFRPRQGLEAGLTGLLSMSAVAILREFHPWEKWLRH